MSSWNPFRRLMQWLRGLFLSQHMELTILGIQGAGKTTLLNVLADENFHRDSQFLNTIPTQGLNHRKVKRGNVNIKIWDIGGQQRFRGMWWRYCRGVDAIIYVVDSADHQELPTACEELHDLTHNSHVQADIPLLVLGNKNDLPNALSEAELIEHLQLRALSGRPVSCYSISCRNNVNIDKVLQWLTRNARRE
eukprot:TRINITY_DN70323_c0_g1_i1.p1 TRINITY_DN70323_c0_g1~~TRINITY_DN70323_c0_g1_i1.p1  ORF type:complete len:193 (+),score=25.88 TRINITY_DN70323_c0_g1_i1:131-709(+)